MSRRTEVLRGPNRVPSDGERTRSRWTRTRVLTVTVGSVLGLCSLGLIGLGAAAASVAAGNEYVDLGAHGSYRTGSYALVSDSTNWSTQLFGLAHTARLEVAPAQGAKPIFVGTAKPDAVARYLADVGYTTIHKNTGNTRTEHDGAAPAIASVTAIPWQAHASGAGTQTLRWDAQRAGDQTLVVMNADGSPNVRARVVSSAVTVDGLGWISTGMLIGGAVLLAGAITLIVVPGRRARRQRLRTTKPR